MPTRAEMMAAELHKRFPQGVTEHKLTSAERMRRVLELRYLEGMTLEQVGEVMGVTRERVRQIESKALRLIRGNPDMREKAKDALAGINEVNG